MIGGVGMIGAIRAIRAIGVIGGGWGRRPFEVVLDSLGERSCVQLLSISR